jgi:phage tail-like protein
MEARARALVKMPDLVGQPLKKARLILENAGLSVEAVLYRESYEDEDTVLEQKPAPRQMVYLGERVVVGVARRSYLRNLPSIYQRSDATGRNFVRDLLWILQHLFSSVEERLEVIHQYFDALETPEEFLPWLASWTALLLEDDWPLEKKRRIARKAVELYRVRGTVRGLKLFLSLFTDTEPNIRENEWPFKGLRIGVSGHVGVDSVIAPPADLSRCFVLEMPVKFKDLSTEMLVRIHRIIQLEKPMHTAYYLRFLAEKRQQEIRDFFLIGVRSGIGIGHEVLQPLEADMPSDGGAKKHEGEEAPAVASDEAVATAEAGVAAGGSAEADEGAGAGDAPGTDDSTKKPN